MKYEHFIKTLKQCQTPRIRAVAFPKSCSPHKIPEVFAALIPHIIKLLEEHIAHFCQTNYQILVLFGLQPSSININTSVPITLNRIINRQQPTNHLCCSLTYLVVSKKEFENINSWQGAQAIIIDFTTGLVMDGKHYISLLFNEPSKGIIYGELNKNILTEVWAMAKTSYHVSNIDINKFACAA